MPDSIYADIILDYYKNPRNFGKIENSDASAHDLNPLCGDEIEIHLKVDNNKFSDVKFSGHGCAISQATASMLTEFVMGKSLDEVKSMTKDDITDLIGIELSYVRIKCALLSLKVLKLATYQYMGERMSDKEKDTL